MRLLVLALALTGCADRPPSCDDVERTVAYTAATVDHALGSGIAGALGDAGLRPSEFMPLYGSAFATELGARCRDGKLDAEGRKCFVDARTGIALDRCSHRYAR